MTARIAYRLKSTMMMTKVMPGRKRSTTEDDAEYYGQGRSGLESGTEDEYYGQGSNTLELNQAINLPYSPTHNTNSYQAINF